MGRRGRRRTGAHTGYFLHWDGVQWSVIPSPSVPNGSTLNGIWADTPNDAWAVGNAAVPARSPPLGCPVVGRADPDPSRSYPTLLAVAGSGSHDVWATGYYCTGQCVGTSRAFSEHSDGRAWTLVTAPNPGAGSTHYYGMAAWPNGVWAAGSGNEVGALTAYYPGACLTPTPTICPVTRQTISSPNVPGADNDLHAVAAAAPDDVWAVGDVWDPTPAALLLHWDGTQWAIVPGAALPPGSVELDGAAALAPDDAWAVGFDSAGALTEHWDGTQWSVVPAAGAGQLYAVAGVASDDVWAVGFGGNGLIEHWNGLAWISCRGQASPATTASAR